MTGEDTEGTGVCLVIVVARTVCEVHVLSHHVGWVAQGRQWDACRSQ